MRCLITVTCLLWACFSFAQSSISNSSSSGEGYFTPDAGVCLSPAERNQIKAELQNSIMQLREAGRLPLPADFRTMITGFDWPVVPAPGSKYNHVDAISNYVDQNTSSALLDWNCGSRTYNGHHGLDIFTWPFGWYLMDNELAHVVAAAAGTIIFKQDGNFDRNCAWVGGLSWNAIYIQHADGSIAWYGHMKNGSLTSKGVGDAVLAGEYLGVVGSSGFSTGPHLHFEIYDGSGNLIDPYSGSCNSLNASSWWNSQEDYRNSQLNHIMTADAVPVFPSCPTQETPNESTGFNPGQTIYYVSFYRDREVGSSAVFRVRKPDGTIHDSWSNSASTTYSASWYWFSRTIPSSPQFGTWKFEVDFDGESLITEFQVCATGTSCDCPAPTSLSATGVTSSSATLNWSSISGAAGYQIRGGPTGGAAKSRIVSGNSTTVPVSGSTTYDWMVRTGCSGGSVISDWSLQSSFTTFGPRLHSGDQLLWINDQLHLKSKQTAEWQIFDLNGKLLTQESATEISTSFLPPGVYLATWIGTAGEHSIQGSQGRSPFVIVR